MRHSAILVYPIASVPHCGLFNRWAPMNPTARNFACLAVAVLASWLLASWLRFGWSELFINDRAFTLYWGLISVGTLMNWLFYLIFFFALGALLAPMLVSHRTWVWGLSLGPSYSLLRYVLGNNWVAADAGFYVYLALLGEYFMPALGGFLGVFSFGHLRSRTLVPN